MCERVEREGETERRRERGREGEMERENRERKREISGKPSWNLTCLSKGIHTQTHSNLWLQMIPQNCMCLIKVKKKKLHTLSQKC